MILIAFQVNVRRVFYDVRSTVYKTRNLRIRTIIQFDVCSFVLHIIIVTIVLFKPFIYNMTHWKRLKITRNFCFYFRFRRWTTYKTLEGAFWLTHFKDLETMLWAYNSYMKRNFNLLLLYDYRDINDIKNSRLLTHTCAWYNKIWSIIYYK